MAPTGNKCTGCRHNITTKEYLVCSNCSSKYDLLCANIGIKKFTSMSQELRLTWKCPECHSKKPKTDNTNTPLRQPALTMPQSPVDVCGNEDTTSDVSNVTVRARHRQQSQTTSSGDGFVTENTLRKILKEELSSLIEENIKKTVSFQLRNINERIMEFTETVAFFNKQHEEMKAELQEKSVTIAELQKDNQTLHSTVKDLNHRLLLAEQNLRESNLEINGIPEHKTENLSTVVAQIARTVDCNVLDEDVCHVTRVAKLNKESDRPRTVIVKLRSPRHRDAMLAAVAKFNKSNPKSKLSTQHLGLAGSPKPVFVSEHLTPANKSLHAAARLKAKTESYKFTWIRNGRIYVRKDEFSPAILIRNHESLNLINPSHRS